MNSTRGQTIKFLLEKRARSDLAALYRPGMEVQVNVAKDEGERKDGFLGKAKGRTFSDGVESWYDFRIPKNAWHEPEDNSGQEMTFSLLDRADAIGMTGWCFSELRSCWVAFDFDAIVGHSERHTKKLEDSELKRVQEAACSIPWVQVRRSTSGSGLHLYVFFAEEVPTKNHDEHASLARAVLAEMSALVGYDFENKVDTCGGNIWVWARRMKGTEGLSLVKQHATKLTQVPKNWKQHLRVVKGNRKKTLPEFAEADAEGFDELAGQHQRTKLDTEHTKLISWLQENNGWGWWDTDHHMLVTHTKHLERAHQALSMRGSFKTSSEGRDLESPNSYAWPLVNGAWSVRRYSKGAAEDPSWEQDGKGWTRCFLNKDPDLRTASRSAGGVEMADGSFAFREAEVAAAVVKSLGGTLDTPIIVKTRPTKLKMHKDGKKLILELEKFSSDKASDLLGWYEEKNKWKIVVNANIKSVEAELVSMDDLLRHATTESNMDAGWFVHVDTNWNRESSGNISRVLAAKGHKKTEADALMGASVLRPWTLVSRPFQEEYPGDRLWNRSRAQYRYPIQDEISAFPHWDAVYSHCGEGLNEALSQSGWALANDIKSGKEYLQLWVAAMLQEPYQPLPYLFFFSGEHQNCGKSVFHESIDLLITSGRVLTNSIFEKDEKFNYQMEGAVLCVIEEMDLHQNKKAYERVKIWVTSPEVLIRKMYSDPYTLPNTTHWVHTANKHTACPIFPGDTRITMSQVQPLDPKNMIPKPELIDKLKKEAPSFLSFLLGLEIPPSGSRLRIPEISTGEKESISSQNRTPLEEFIETKCFHVPGERVLFSDFYDRFREQLDPADLHSWSSKNMVSRSMPLHLPTGKVGMDSCIGNLSFTPLKEGTPPKRKLIARDKKLVSS